MKIKEYALKKVQKTELGSRLIEDKRYRVIVKAIIGLVFNLLFAFYNGILGVLSSSLIFISSSVYYFLLSSMRFSAVLLNRKGKRQNDSLIVSIVGVMLIILSVVFHIMVIVSMKYNTAAMYGTVTMIAIATFTFTKITVAVITAFKHKGEHSKLLRLSIQSGTPKLRYRFLQCSSQCLYHLRVLIKKVR